MINEINAEREKSDWLTVAKLNAVKQFNKQDYKSKLMTEKYLLLPLNSQQLTPIQTAIQRMSEKHPDFETAYVSIFTDNDLTHITEDHFEIKLIARLLDQIYVIPAPVFPPRYDDALPSAPQFPEHLHSLLTCS